MGCGLLSIARAAQRLACTLIVMADVLLQGDIFSKPAALAMPAIDFIVTDVDPPDYCIVAPDTRVALAQLSGEQGVTKNQDVRGRQQREAAKQTSSARQLPSDQQREAAAQRQQREAAAQRQQREAVERQQREAARATAA
ncbi:hypothetical protein D9Q98_004249 [Chlorella vulgaris]|uniref:Uncharacterized protein n=1 Tax=Chlorella vulgaris TaxID=3077 RepID=A0A9D4TRX3_CHLVU|nr:hypothetical protein D9Q98_004249 [Chlorella vulgaris]